MSLIDVIYSFATGNAEPTPKQYLVMRTSSSTYGSNGMVNPGTTSTLFITASVTPTEGRVASVVFDANTTIETRTLYTDTQLFSRWPGQDPDQITIDNEPWWVHAVKRFEYFEETFYVVKLTRRLAAGDPDAGS